METIIKGVNIAPSSESGHYVQNAKNVIELDLVTESFLVEGKSELTTKNHTTLSQEESCFISCQTVFNPFQERFEKSKD